jgi:hypothetical protein
MGEMIEVSLRIALISWLVCIHHTMMPACTGTRRLFHSWHPPHQSDMEGHPENRTPVEIWERILFSVINDSQTELLLNATCTAATYLAFKRTCGDAKSHAYPHPYRVSEQNRRAIRLVCRAWKEFADRWKSKRRWIRIKYLSTNIDEETWRGALRVDFYETSGSWCINGNQFLDLTQVMKIRFHQWKMLGVEGGYGMRLQRLEMLHLPKEQFSGIFKSLCDVSKVLKELRSLSISLPSNQTHCFKALSSAFPDLTHLTLHLTDRFINSATNDDQEDLTESRALVHHKIETLFIFSQQSIQFDNWRLPRLQHVHLQPAGLFWRDEVYPFLERHGDNIVTLDLDGTTDGTTSTRVPDLTADVRGIPAGFWDTFPRLQLLRCALWLVVFEDFPRTGHPLKYLVDTDAVESARRLVRILRPWVNGNEQITVKSITVFGPFLSREHHRSEGGELKQLLHLMRWNGIKLVNPAGRQWIESL